MMYGALLLVVVIAAGEALAQVSLTAYPSVLTTPNQEVSLKWAGVAVQDASEWDFVALYSPSSSGLEQELGWILAAEVAEYYNSTGAGVTAIPLINMRTDYIFRFWKSYNGSLKGNTTRTAPFKVPKNVSFELVASSNIVSFSSPNEPLQGHLSLTPNVSEMRIMWVSGDNSSVPIVRYGLQASLLSEEVVGNTTTYQISDMCAAPANTTPNWRNPGYIHDAIMINLAPSTKYYYQFGDNATGWSSIYSFFSSPTTGPQSEAYVIAYGDLGVSTPYNMAQEQQLPSSNTIEFAVDTVNSPSYLSGDAVDNTPWLALHVGDISYARGYAFLWEYFFNLIQPLATQVPYMVCIGNHEYDYIGQPFSPKGYGYGTDSGGECGIPYLRRFNMPRTGQAESDLWYSFNYGPIHFLIMSTEHDFTVGSPQYNYLVEDLASVDRSVTPFVIFSGHRPMYSSMGNWPPVRDILEPVVVKYNVNLCLWGHVHNYERTCGVVNGVCADSDDDAPVHIVIGMGGNTFNLAWDGVDSKKGGEEVEPEWSIFRTITYGYTRFFANSTHLHLEFVTNQRNEVHDELWLHAN